MTSLPTSAAWQTAPIHSSSSLSAQPVTSENGPASTAPPVNPPAASSSEHDASDRAQQQDATGAEASHPVVRRGTSKTEDSDATDNVSGTAASAAAPGTAPVAFQAVLNEVMPEAADEKPPYGRQAVDAQPVQSGKSATDSTTGGKMQAVRSALDPTFQITRQATPAAPSGALSQKLADGEVAFAARVAQRAGEQATVNLRDPGTVIAESRFDTSRAQASGAQTDAQAATAAKNTDAAAPQAKTQAEQTTQPAAESQSAGDGNSNGASGGQGNGNATDAVEGVRAGSESQDDGGALQAAQHTMTAMSAVAPADGGARSPGAAKVSAENTTPQIPEPQGETTARAGESVREISLRLSNAEQGSVQVRLSERAGELHVTVRTPDTGLTRGLRDALPDLVGRLQVNGYKAETWQPGGNGSNTGQNYGQDGRGNSQQRQGGGNSQQNSQQQQQDEQTPQWAREMESSIQRSNNQWAASPTR